MFQGARDVQINDGQFTVVGRDSITHHHYEYRSARWFFEQGELTLVTPNQSHIPKTPIQIISMVYGDTELMNPTAFHRFYTAITNRETIEISNENLGGDPLEGIQKTFIIEYKNSGNLDDSVVKRRRMLEREEIDFGWDITNVTYGGFPLGSRPHVYEKLFWALDNQEGIEISNEMTGFDPAHGVAKALKVTYTDGERVYTTAAMEGADLTFPMRN
ncbi:hypothetical protein BKA70DRAFT_1237264 [Coprinopsis sp. MPI-PUGE-AT-0042]|nr:hypothetical protein BKA70DRAFT_1237264 [Coprinopsis sp. MPI-PUGE-AT-0042]